MPAWNVVRPLGPLFSCIIPGDALLWVVVFQQGASLLLFLRQAFPDPNEFAFSLNRAFDGWGHLSIEYMVSL